jgi:3D (Asp-Asp-Asp) domain-containing protein
MTIKSIPSGATASAVALASFLSVLLANPLIAETPSKIKRNKQTQPKLVAAGDGEGDVASTPTSEASAPVKAGENSAETTENAPVHRFVATAYSLRGITASGRPVSKGVIAADRRVLPLGSRVRLEAGHYSGEYTVSDTGSLVRGKKIDIWMPSTREAMRFGRRQVKLTVLNYGKRPRTALKSGVLIRAKR